MSRSGPEKLAIATGKAHLLVRGLRRWVREKTVVSKHQKHKLFQQFLVAASSLCVGMILARAMGF